MGWPSAEGVLPRVKNQGSETSRTGGLGSPRTVEPEREKERKKVSWL